MTSSGHAALAVHAHVALVLPPLHAALRAVGALAVHEAQVAVRALRVILLHPEEREARDDPEKRAERAERAAPEPRDEAVHEQRRNEEKRDEPRLVEIELARRPHGAREEILGNVARGLQRSHVGGRDGGPAANAEVLERWKHAEADGADRDADRIEEPPDGAARDRRGEEREHQIVLRELPTLRVIGFDPLLSANVAGRKDPREEVVQRPERADPAAEHAPEGEGEPDDGKRPREPAIDGVRREQRHGGHERIREQEPLDGPRQAHRSVGACREGAAEGRVEEQEEKEPDEKHLTSAPRPDELPDDRASRNPGSASLLLGGRARAPLSTTARDCRQIEIGSLADRHFRRLDRLGRGRHRNRGWHLAGRDRQSAAMGRVFLPRRRRHRQRIGDGQIPPARRRGTSARGSNGERTIERLDGPWLAEPRDG